MAKKQVNVFIGAKNKMANGLRSATKSLRKFGRSAGKLMKNVAKGVAVVGVAVLALSVKMVKAWSIQESAEKSLSEALLAQGDSVDTLMVKYKKLASAIQDETGVGDESTLALIAKLRTIGVTNAKMEDAVKLTMALSKAGMREKTAFRAAADAMNGNTTALTTYIPELRQATTQAEKMAVVNSLAVRGYKQLSGELDTNAGRWTELKGRIGDVFERIGKVISGGLDLKNTMAKLSDKIKAFGSSPKFDAFLGRLQNGIQHAKDLIKVLASGGDKKDAAIRGIGEIIKLSFISGAQTAVNVLAKGMSAAWGIMSDKMSAGVKDYAKMLRNPLYAAKRLGGMAGAASVKGGEIAGNLIDTKQTKADLARAISDLANIKPKFDNMPTDIFRPTVKRTEGNKSSVTGGVAGDGAMSGSTSMLGVGELFTMMQTGQAKATELGELQKQNTTLEKILVAVEGEGIE
jgi:hypothetical protein